MRRALAAIGLVLAACQGGSTPPPPCGALGEACCASEACDGDLTCSGGTCQAPVACGALSQACCNGTTCDTGLTCTGGTCQIPPCGALGEACCASDTCDGALVCLSGSCAEDPCRLDAPGVTWLAFTSTRAGNYDIYRVHEDGSCLAPVTTDTDADLSPAWTADGKLGFVRTGASGSGIFVHDLATGTDGGVALLSSVIPSAPAFAPGGSWVAFEGMVPATNRSDVYVALTGGGVPSPLTTTPGSNAGPVYSPDGSTIYFVSNRSNGWNIYKMDAATGDNETLIPGTKGILGRPAVSPDGTTLAYCKLDTGGVAEVVRHVLADDSEVVVSAQGDSEPVFDPTGTRLAVSSTRSGQSAIWLIDAADGANAVQVTTPPGSAVDGQPAFPW